AEAEQHAIRLLAAAAGLMGDALRGMDDALSRSRMDAFGVGGAMADAAERGALQRAEAAVREALALVAQAGRATPHVGAGLLPPVVIAGGGGLADADVLFDNVFTDVAFHDEIKKSRLSVERCATALGGVLRDTRARHRELTRRLGAQGARLESTRTALQKEREKVFERIAGGRVDAGGPAAASSTP
ncbi:hypothetical protein LX36DRAFT_553590, partial [Colletotrichum falcatum]